MSSEIRRVHAGDAVELDGRRLLERTDSLDGKTQQAAGRPSTAKGSVPHRSWRLLRHAAQAHKRGQPDARLEVWLEQHAEVRL